MPAAGDRILATDTATLTSYVLTPPICRLIQQAAQSIPTTNAALTFGAGSEDIDTNNFHDPTTNNTRITPNIAGYYEFDATLYVTTTTSTAGAQIFIMKNGVILPPGHFNSGGFVAGSNGISTGITVATANGTTDFFEARAGFSNASHTTLVSGGLNSTFTCTFKRPL